MNNGYFAIFRKLFESDLWSNHKACRLFIFILGNVSHVKSKMSARYQCVALEPGRMLSGRKKLAQRCGFTERETRTALTYLISTSRITVQSTNRYSIISVVNWQTYRDEQTKYSQQKNRDRDQQTTSRRPADDHIQEVNKLISTLPDANASGTGASPAGEDYPAKGKRSCKKHPAYKMSPDQYEDFVRNGIRDIQANEEKIDQWGRLFPGINVKEEIFDAAAWLLDRTEEEKYRRPKLIPFIGNWLRKANKKACGNNSGGKYDSFSA